jgi:hypothetical protein
MPGDLFSALADEVAEARSSASRRRLDDFVERLVREDPHFNSDGISFWRVVERGATRLRIAGNIWHIAQTIHAFWLDLERQAPGSDELHYSFYFDVVPGPGSPRRIDLVAESIDYADEAEWRVVATGSAHVRPDGSLVVNAPTT